MQRFLFQAFLSPEEDGGYSVEFPDLPGCLTCGDDFEDAVEMAADAGMTWVAAQMKDNEPIPTFQRHETPKGCESVFVSFETYPDYVVDGPVVSASEAARMLHVSRSRITQLLASGQLEGLRNDEGTWVTVASIGKRCASHPKAGRPRKTLIEA
jgi:predicted RNase H-like HicB family nuclease